MKHRDDHTPEGIKAGSDEILCEALGIEDAAERAAFVEKACAGDDEVRKRVERLLSHREKANDLFRAATPTRFSASELVNTFTDIPEFFEEMKPVLPDDDEVGKQIGPYKLLQKIGEGGAGNVYLAEQARPVRRQVALKIVKAGMDTKSVIARFEAERQALAMMEHPNIARVLNAGATDTGRPYFVMELVHGERITTYCNENRLNIRKRLELFIQVCHAIQHAHQKGIIHRDIKPSNVLITLHDGVPRPVVIDFGIAKATHGDLLTDKTLHTAEEHWIGTPAYMSPEQVDRMGVDIDTRSDIFSLGVLLYELLIGQPPFTQQELIQSGLEEMRRTLLQREPPTPSARLLRMEPADRTAVAAARGLDAHRLGAELRGDLDWIALKAMEKDRARRYETASALAMDVAHYLNVEPVVARPPSRVYRFRKLVRRNKVMTVAIAAVSLSLIAGLGLSSWLLAKEREARQRAVLAEQEARAAQAKALIAEQEQMYLRQEAEDRERIAMAAFLISQERLEEAFMEVDQVTTELRPSLETGSVLRRIAEWLSLRGEWELAVKYFKILLDVDIRDSSSAITDDLLMAGPVLVEHAGGVDYESFRRVAIARCQGTRNPRTAERVLKISLLLPADDEIMQLLEPFADVSAEATRNPRKNDTVAAWRCISLALWSCRKGDYPAAKEWARMSIELAEGNEVRDATAHVIRAMACFYLNERDEARAERTAGKRIVDERLESGLKIGGGREGLWFDVLFARILLREAEGLTDMQPE